MTNKGRIECSSPESKLQYLESSSSDSSPDKRTLVEANNAINLFNEGWPPETKRSTTVSPNKDSAHNAETKLDIEETSSVFHKKHSQLLLQIYLWIINLIFPIQKFMHVETLNVIHRYQID